jgi:hypothetical protein
LRLSTNIWRTDRRIMANRPIELKATLDASDVDKNVKKMAAGLQDIPDAAGKASGEMRNLADSTDQTATKTGIMASALGAFAGGLEAVGLEKYGVALQASAVGVDVFSNASDVATLALESKYVKLLRDKAATVASTAASLAASAASKAMAAGQWLLNAALSANPIGLVVVAIGALAAGLVLAYKKSETFRNIVNGVFGGIKDFVWPIIKFLGEGVVKALSAVLNFVLGPFKAIGEKFGLLKDDTNDLKKAIVDTGPPMENFEESQKRLGEETDRAQQYIDDQKKALDDYVDSLTAAQNAVLDLADKQIGVAEATDAASKAAKENGKTHDINTEKGRNNEKALHALAKATNENTVAMVQNGQAELTTAAKAEASRKNFVKLATQMGYSRAEAEALARKMIAIPNVSREAKLRGNVADLDAKIAAAKKHLGDKGLTDPQKTKIKADIADLVAKKAAAVKELNALPKTKTIVVQWKNTSSGSIPLNTIGSLGRRAAGGPVDKNTPYIVGENGPEILVPDGSGTIIPNHKLSFASPRGTATAAGSAPSITFNNSTFIGSSKAELQRWLRELLESDLRYNGAGWLKERLA